LDREDHVPVQGRVAGRVAGRRRARPACLGPEGGGVTKVLRPERLVGESGRQRIEPADVVLLAGADQLAPNLVVGDLRDDERCAGAQQVIGPVPYGRASPKAAGLLSTFGASRLGESVQELRTRRRPLLLVTDLGDGGQRGGGAFHGRHRRTDGRAQRS